MLHKAEEWKVISHAPKIKMMFLIDGDPITWPWPTYWSTMAAFMLSWSVLLTARIVLLNSGERFRLLPVMSAADLMLAKEEYILNTEDFEQVKGRLDKLAASGRKSSDPRGQTASLRRGRLQDAAMN